jgi:hypothetical protein
MDRDETDDLKSRACEIAFGVAIEHRRASRWLSACVKVGDRSLLLRGQLQTNVFNCIYHLN